METKVFEVGKRYQMHSACDSDCVWTYEVISRTKCMVELVQVNNGGERIGVPARFRINQQMTERRHAEAISPLGSYSMSPVLSADNIVKANVVEFAFGIVRQYDEVKAKYSDAMILMRRGEWYDTYRDDAKACAKVLGITLCHIGGVECAGFPKKGLDVYLPKLVRNGYRIAIVDAEMEPSVRRSERERFC